MRMRDTNLKIGKAGTAGLVLLALSVNLSWAAEKTKYFDIYLTQDRVCKACTGRWINERQVALTNRQGETAVVEADEILGVDDHPFLRKIFMKGLYGTGLAGKVIVPHAFDDYQDFVCKYCDP